MPQYLMGIDAGTSVIKAAIFDVHGNELSRGAHNVPIDNPTTYDEYFAIYREYREAMPPIWDKLQTITRRA